MSPENHAEVHDFTRDWWGRLPRAWRIADREQNPEAGAVPLLRWMDGIGQIAGRTRDLNSDMWEGRLLDPDHTPDHLLPWLGWLLGMSEHRRQAPPATLRDRIRAQIASGSHGVGTRRHIAASVREFLHEGGQVQILASASYPFTLVIGVAEDDVPGADYGLLEERIRAAGVIPAGHVLVVQDVRTTWDAWEDAAGETWDDKETNISTWDDSDTAGVTFEEP